MPHNFEFDFGHADNEQAIEEGIAWSELSNQLIDDTTARMIATLLYSSRDSAMYSMAETGTIDYKALYYEMMRDYTAPHADETVRRWLDHLARYRDLCGERGPVDGWEDLWRGPENLDI